MGTISIPVQSAITSIEPGDDFLLAVRMVSGRSLALRQSPCGLRRSSTGNALETPDDGPSE